MIGDLVEWLLGRLGVERFDVGERGSVYLTRWTLWGRRAEGVGLRVYLHRFRRSDNAEALHDHPWDFRSLILWGGYWEHTREWDEEALMYCSRRRWRWPGSLLRREAETAHRVELPPGRHCWTLVFVGTKRRSWGFHCPAGWVPWREFVGRSGRGAAGCGEKEGGAP